ncbi:hypothetical protein F9C07_2219405 [Aspergillus flavus]|uniref:Tat pathway signal sequence n=1 Tax=Aspergillus flavus (strain ATCC 200026 / FGSC A1120 / IAM 13836 / NRRL 3357 / JCM 12722 / SRRC 167) TaxID=332952 RepID=A0A7U2QY11_ASPFN|nr:hypothetical protein F9C07_2219405 [Aspergillus flavus]
MDDQVIQLAEQHYIAEQTARHIRIWGNQYQPLLVPLCPNFKEIWSSIAPTLRQPYVERVRALASSTTPTGAQAQYRDILKTLYEKSYAEMTQSVAEETWFVPLSQFEQSIGQLGTRSLDIQDDENSDDDRTVCSQDEDMDMAHTSVPMEYDPRKYEDPKISTLETAVKEGLLALNKLQQAFEGSDVRNADIDWKPQIERTLSISQTEKVIIGLNGSTGAGKSSLINAIVDEENIVATNCMRASTAVATELLYNDGESRYKAQIEFIELRDWEQELRILFEDLLDSHEDVIRGDLQKNSDAAVALDKIKAVYPLLEVKDILNTSVEALMEHSNVSDLLGSVHVFEQNDPKVFSRMVKSYIDSRGRRGRSEKGPEKGRDMKYWPLIRVVRIFLKAPALITGAVLVDLPGLHDTNAARVEVAKEYSKRCSAHWIITPINRAVDDKVARDLLGQSFKMQMQMDCSFNNITFVCTKTDHITVSEVQDSLKLRLPSMQEREQRDRKRAQLGAELKLLQEGKGRVMEELSLLDDEIEELESCLFNEESSLNLSQLTPIKRKRHSDLEKDVTANPNAEVPSTPILHVSATDTQPSADSEIDELLRKFRSLKSERKVLDTQRREIYQQIQINKAALKRVQAESDNMRADTLRECIEARNEYSKHEIKRDYANGIRDLDEEDQDTLAPSDRSKLARNYKKIEDELPSYQKLRGRLRKESAVAGFTQLEQTEIPQLQRHCISLTERAREASAMRFLTQLKQLFQSISLWSLETGQAHIMSAEEIQELEAEQWWPNIDSLRHEFEKTIIRRFDPAMKHASEKIPGIISGWNAPRSEGGLHIQTYRATCRRRGMFRELDWNQQLVNPLLKRVIQGWTTMFNEKVPGHFFQLKGDLAEILEQYHRRAIALVERRSVTKESKDMLDKALSICCKSMGEQLGKINRMFAETIRTKLMPTYEECAEQKGESLQFLSHKGVLAPSPV